MEMKGRRMSLRESFMGVLSRRSLIPKKVNKLRGVKLFRSAVRRILMYLAWITEVPEVEEIVDDVTMNIRKAQAKKVEKKMLTKEDRSILLTSPEDRTSVEKSYIYELFKKFHVFRRYPENLREILAGVCCYQYLEPGRIILKQDRVAENVYFIVSGEVSSSRVVIDRWTGEEKEIDVGLLKAGDIFGQIAVMHKIPRSATVITKTTVDLIFISSEDFDVILRPALTKEWNALQDALIHFNYFKGWDEKAIRECCILSKLKDFDADEILLGDGKGMVNYVHFLLNGECQLIEHIIVREERVTNGVNFSLYDPKTTDSKEDMIRSSKSLQEQELKMDELEHEHKSTRTGTIDVIDNERYFDYAQMLLSSRPADKRIDLERTSIITTTLLDVINEWHKITDVTEMLLREPSSISQQRYPSNVRTIFMQICTFNRGACFGLGENMIDRRIVSKTPVRCFLVPRYWLDEHNRANIWERVKLFMDSKFPTKEQLFEEFVNNRRWLKYKRTLVNDIRRRNKPIHGNVTLHDVPYSIKIVNDVN